MLSLLALHLTRSDVQTKWGWVVVLEELKAQSVGRAHLNALGGAGGARARGDGVAVTGLDSD